MNNYNGSFISIATPTAGIHPKKNVAYPTPTCERHSLYDISEAIYGINAINSQAKNHVATNATIVIVFFIYNCLVTCIYNTTH